MHDRQANSVYFLAAFLAITIVLLTGCSSDEAGTEAATQGGSDTIAKLYNTSCISCHAGGNAAAPRAHDVAAWQPKLAKGDEVLLANVKNGFAAMPAKGMCYDCSDDQLRELISYMAAAKPAR